MKTSSILKKLNRRDTRIIPKLPLYTKFALIILTLIGISLFSKTIFAQTNILKEKQDAIKKGNNQEAWLTEAMGNNLFGVMTMVSGTLEFNEDGSLKTTGYAPGGFIGGTNRMISSLYKAPASGIEYIAMVKDNFLGKPAYAQSSNGVGYAGLSPLLPAWKTFRNMTYVISSLLFVMIGISIMLRVKVSPQAVISIQSSLPKVITALILITFSYAIAGLIIDLSNLFLTITLALFFTTNNTAFSSNLFNTPVFDGSGFPLTSWVGNIIQVGYQSLAQLFGADAPYNLTNLTNSNFGKLYDLTNRAVPAASGFVLGEVAGQIFLGTLLGGLGNVALGGLGRDVVGGVGAVAGDAVGGILGALLLPIIISILMSFWLIKLYFGLLKNYVLIIFRIIIAPLEIFMGALPNSKMGFSTWIMYIIAHISVFPITVIFLVFLNYLTDILVRGQLWIPSQMDLITLGGNNNVVAAGIGLAGIALLAKLPALIPEFIFSIKPSPYGKAIGEAYTGNLLSKATTGSINRGVTENVGGRVNTAINTGTVDVSNRFTAFRDRMRSAASRRRSGRW